MQAQYTLIIGTKRYSSWSLRPWLAMKMAGIGFDEILIVLRRADSPERLAAHSPSEKVPALRIAETGQSLTVWDTLAICETLAERHPDKAMWPRDAAARAEARSVSAEMHSGFSDVRRLMPMDLGRTHPAPEGDENLRKQIARLIAIWESALMRHGGNGGFLFGAFSIADAFFAPVVSRFETYGTALPPASDAYCKRVLGLAPMREWRQAALAEPDSI